MNPVSLYEQELKTSSGPRVEDIALQQEVMLGCQLGERVICSVVVLRD